LRASFRPTVCRHCGNTRDPAELDHSHWCVSCRQTIVRRSATWARVSAFVVCLGLAVWIAVTMQPTRFLVGWMAILAFTYFVVSKIVQRVAFEVIRARTAPSTHPEDTDG